MTIFEPTEPNTSLKTLPTGSAFSPLRIALKSGWARISAAVTKIAAAPPM